MLELLNKYKFYILGAIALIWLGWVFYTMKPQMPTEYKQAIDSLTKANTALQQKQNHLDSVIGGYETQISDLNTKIAGIKEKTVIVREYYHEISKEVQTYNTHQVDSFLRNRFNY